MRGESFTLDNIVKRLTQDWCYYYRWCTFQQTRKNITMWRIISLSESEIFLWHRLWPSFLGSSRLRLLICIQFDSRPVLVSHVPFDAVIFIDPHSDQNRLHSTTSLRRITMLARLHHFCTTYTVLRKTFEHFLDTMRQITFYLQRLFLKPQWCITSALCCGL